MSLPEEKRYECLLADGLAGLVCVRGRAHRERSADEVCEVLVLALVRERKADYGRQEGAELSCALAVSQKLFHGDPEQMRISQGGAPMPWALAGVR